MVLTYCLHCGTITPHIVEDVGIGPYEFWGTPGDDVRKIAYCSRCKEVNDEVDLGEDPS